MLCITDVSPFSRAVQYIHGDYAQEVAEDPVVKRILKTLISAMDTAYRRADQSYVGYCALYIDSLPLSAGLS